jgi:hypothetical protein
MLMPHANVFVLIVAIMIGQILITGSAIYIKDLDALDGSLAG